MYSALSRAAICSIISRRSASSSDPSCTTLSCRSAVAGVLHFYLDRGFEFGGCLARLFHLLSPRLRTRWFRSEDSARPSNLNTFLMPLLDPGIFLSHVSRSERPGGLSMLPRGRNCARQPAQPE